jgi:hypothetical protein
MYRHDRHRIMLFTALQQLVRPSLVVDFASSRRLGGRRGGLIRT